jgi:hypothetical protein
MTIRGIDLITKFAYLKNGAMYAIGILGAIMTLESFGQEFPFWVAPLSMVVFLSLFLLMSIHANRKETIVLK